MPTVLHPRALDSVDGKPPHRVVINRERYVIDQDSFTVDLESEQEAQNLADSHGVDRDALDPDGAGGESEPPDTDTPPGEDVCTCDPGEACGSCGGDCPTVKADGDVCGRDRPCAYHD